MSQPGDPPILAYHRPQRRPPQNFMLLAYCAGLALATTVTVAVAMVGDMIFHAPLDESVLFPFVWLIFEIFVGAAILEASLSLTTKVFPNVRFSSFRRALCWGIAAGLVAPPIPILAVGLFALPELVGRALGLCTLACQFIIPAVAGRFLCQRLPD